LNGEAISPHANDAYGIYGLLYPKTNASLIQCGLNGLTATFPSQFTGLID
jgi:hypothetical protein